MSKPKPTAHKAGPSRRGRSLSSQLRAARGERTQADFARALGVSLRNLQNWEQGHRQPRGLALQTLLERLTG